MYQIQSFLCTSVSHVRVSYQNFLEVENDESMIRALKTLVDALGEAHTLDLLIWFRYVV